MDVVAKKICSGVEAQTGNQRKDPQRGTLVLRPKTYTVPWSGCKSRKDCVRLCQTHAHFAQRKCTQAEVRAALLLCLRTRIQNTGRLSSSAHPITHKTLTAHSRARAIHNVRIQRTQHAQLCCTSSSLQILLLPFEAGGKNTQLFAMRVCHVIVELLQRIAASKESVLCL